jgi:hypothetical protein
MVLSFILRAEHTFLHFSDFSHVLLYKELRPYSGYYEVTSQNQYSHVESLTVVAEVKEVRSWTFDPEHCIIGSWDPNIYILNISFIIYICS